jgi:CO/xanthine dehydrogenase Mo-binding subunit
MLHAKLKRSPYPHARIVRIDTSRAERLAGVKTVMTAADVPEIHCGLVLKDRYFIARDRVRFVGEPVAADAIEAAEDAVDLVEVEYEELPAVFDPEKSMRPDPPAVLHPDLPTYDKGLIPMPQTEPFLRMFTAISKFAGGTPRRAFKRPIWLSRIATRLL